MDLCGIKTFACKMYGSHDFHILMNTASIRTRFFFNTL